MLENSIKELIISKYGSVRQFAMQINLPYTTVDSILKRGIDNSNVGNVIKMCKELKISIDKLIDNKTISFVLDDSEISPLTTKSEDTDNYKKISTENVSIYIDKEKNLTAEDVLDVNKKLMEELENKD